jgi:RND family efflux transporter MFP subunit
MNTSTLLIFRLCLCTALFLGAFLTNGCKKSSKSATAPPPPEVLVTAVKQQDVSITKEWLATLDGSINVKVTSRVQGYLLRQTYKEGSVVKEGDVLFEIDSRPFEAAMAQASADLARAKAAQINTENIERRQVQLFASKTVSEADRDTAVQNSAAAKAATLAASAALDQAKLNVEYTKILSPVTGIAGIAVPGIGDLVGPASGVMVQISKVDPIKASIQISEAEYYQFAEQLNQASRRETPGPAEAELILADGSVFPQKGKMSAVDRQIDQRTGTLRVDVLFPNPGNLLRPGFFAKLRAPIRVDKGALLVPQRAVNELQGSYQIALVADGKAEIRPVQVGETVGSMWLVTSGLKPGETVIVEGFQKVRSGAPVAAKPWTPPPAAK